MDAINCPKCSNNDWVSIEKAVSYKKCKVCLYSPHEEYIKNNTFTIEEVQEKSRAVRDEIVRLRAIPQPSLMERASLAKLARDLQRIEKHFQILTLVNQIEEIGGQGGLVKLQFPALDFLYSQNNTHNSIEDNSFVQKTAKALDGTIKNIKEL